MTGVRRPYPGRPGQVRRTWARHPRGALAVEAALAALAWHVAGDVVQTVRRSLDALPAREPAR